MAIGTVTPKITSQRTRTERYTVTDVVLPASYTSPGGDALTADQLGLAKVDHAVSEVKVAGTGAVTSVYYDTVNSKLVAYTATGEVANTTNLGAITVQITAFGS